MRIKFEFCRKSITTHTRILVILPIKTSYNFESGKSFRSPLNLVILYFYSTPNLE